MSYLDLIKEEIAYTHPFGKWERGYGMDAVRFDHTADLSLKDILFFLPKSGDLKHVPSSEQLLPLIRKNATRIQEYEELSFINWQTGELHGHGDLDKAASGALLCNMARLCVLTGAKSISTQELVGSYPNIICVHSQERFYYFLDTYRTVELIFNQNQILPTKTGRYLCRVREDVRFTIPAEINFRGGYELVVSPKEKFMTPIRSFTEDPFTLYLEGNYARPDLLIPYAFSRTLDSYIIWNS